MFWVEVSLSHIWFGNTVFHSVGTFSVSIIIFKCLFIFGCAGFSVLLGFFSSCSEQGYSPVLVLGLLTEVASSCRGARALGSTCSVVAVHRLRCSEARGIFPDQGLNPCLLHWQGDSPPSHQESPSEYALDGLVYNTKVFCFCFCFWGGGFNLSLCSFHCLFFWCCI